MTSRPRRLLVMRHAKAEAFATEDHARALTGRGRADAEEAGRWLAGRGFVPSHAFVSSAVRTVSTWQALERVLDSEAQVSDSDALYAAGPEAALEVLRTAPAEAACVLFVGHNPTAAYLAHLLDDGDPDPDAFRGISEGYPTAAITVLEVHVPWADLAEGTARIAAFHVGRG